ncbi:MAG: argininosuccinate synthase [Bacteroidota bacterium]
MSKKVILGFSGGLDTTYCVKYLSEEKGYEVHSIIVRFHGRGTCQYRKTCTCPGCCIPYHGKCRKNIL